MRPLPSQSTRARYLNNLKRPQGLRKQAEVMQDSATCGTNCGIASFVDRTSLGSQTRLHRLCRVPQNRRVYKFGINRKHLVVQIERGLGMRSSPVEIANVFSCR